MRCRLHDGLCHLNAIEWAASAMEMSAIGARNCANAVREHWRKKMQDQHDNQPEASEEGHKEEL